MEEPFATFHLDAFLPGVHIPPCWMSTWKSDSDSELESFLDNCEKDCYSGSPPAEASKFSSSPAEDSYFGSALAEDSEYTTSSDEDYHSGSALAAESEAESTLAEASKFGSCPAEESDSGSALVEDSDFGPSPTESSEDSFLAEDSGCGFDPVEDAEPGARLAENLRANCALAEDKSSSATSDGSGSGSALTEVPDSGSNLAEKSNSGSDPPEDSFSERSSDLEIRFMQCLQCQKKAIPLHRCWICGSFQGAQGSTVSGFYPETEPTIDELRHSVFYKSSKTGKCEFCPILLSCLERCISPASLRGDLNFYTRAHEGRHDQCHDEPWKCRNWSLSVIIGRFPSEIHACIEIFTLPGIPSPWIGVEEAHDIPQNTASETSLAWAKTWLHYCLKFHSHCNVLDSHRLFPKRLIDVLDCKTNGPVRLIETFGRERQYLTLSHCWGDPRLHPKPLETTKDNLRQHLQGIYWKDLSKTFQDAINFVRSLGERYIWIDSLCIMQDSTEDWADESGKMSSIYQNSLITIAATKSDNSGGGCFSTPDDEYKAHPFVVKYYNGSCFTMYCRRSLPHFHDESYNEADQAPLLKRAWVYQERQLSPRTVQFGSQELIWECREERACECGLWNNLPHSTLKFQKSVWPAANDRSNLRSFHTSMMPGISKPTDEANFVQIWHDAVSEYPRLNLTRASDRLPAIAGIAKLMQTFRCKDEYLAGLWNNSLIEDLIWANYDSKTQSRNTNLAPSWSWACIDVGKVEFDKINDTDFRMASLVKVEVRPDGPDVYLNAPSGFLTMKGYLFATKPEDSLFCVEDSKYIDATGFRLELLPPDCYSSSPPSQTPCLYEGTLKTNSSESQAGGPLSAFHDVLYYPDCSISQFDQLYIASTTLHCLWMIKRPRLPDGKFINLFLVLRQKQSQGLYERVGFLRTIGLSRLAMPPDSEQTDRALKHTITIV